MNLHVVPIVIIILCTLATAYQIGYYRNVRDELYGMSILIPAFIGIFTIVCYYSLYSFFKYVVGLT